MQLATELEGRGLKRSEVSATLGMHEQQYYKIRWVWRKAVDPNGDPRAIKYAETLLDDYDDGGSAYNLHQRLKSYLLALGRQEKKTDDLLTSVERQRQALIGAENVLSGVSYGLTKIGNINKDHSKDEIQSWITDLSNHRRTIEGIINKLRRTLNEHHREDEL